MCVHLHDDGVVPRADKIAGIDPDEILEGGLVALLHGLAQLGCQVLGAGAFEAVGPLPVDGVHLRVVWTR